MVKLPYGSVAFQAAQFGETGRRQFAAQIKGPLLRQSVVAVECANAALHRVLILHEKVLRHSVDTSNLHPIVTPPDGHEAHLLNPADVLVCLLFK